MQPFDIIAAAERIAAEHSKETEAQASARVQARAQQATMRRTEEEARVRAHRRNTLLFLAWCAVDLFIYVTHIIGTAWFVANAIICAVVYVLAERW